MFCGLHWSDLTNRGWPFPRSLTIIRGHVFENGISLLPIVTGYLHVLY